MKLTATQLAKALRLTPRKAAPPAKPAPAPAPAPTPPARTRPPSRTGFNALDASPDDYERRLAQLGLTAPGTEHRRFAPPRDLAAQRAAQRTVDRIERDRVRAQEAHAEAINAGAIDGRNASPEEVRARMQALGVDTTTMITREERTVVPTEAERMVAASVRKAIQSGQHVDVQKLSPGERKALNELGNAGYQVGHSGLGF